MMGNSGVFSFSIYQGVTLAIILQYKTVSHLIINTNQPTSFVTESAAKDGRLVHIASKS